MSVAASPAALNEQRPEPLHRALQDGALGDFKAVSDVAACLMPALDALGWRGDPRHVAEALPHFANGLDLTGFRNTLAYLNFNSRPVRLTLDRIDPILTPCLFVPDEGSAMVVLEMCGESIRVFDGGANDFATIPAAATAGTAYFFNTIDTSTSPDAPSRRTDWFRHIAERFRGLMKQLLLATFLLNLMALAVPIFIMLIYDKVVGTGSYSTLVYLSLGVAVLFAAEAAFRMIRSKILAFVGARIDTLVGTGVFQHILHLAPIHTERAAIGSQVARIKEFEAVREFFTSPLALVFLELPFALLFIAVVAIIAGPVAVVPVVMVGCFLIIGLILIPRVRQSVRESSQAGASRQGYLVETLSNIRAVKFCSCEDTWLDRHSKITATAIMASFKTARLSALVQTFAHMLMLGAGVGTLSWGISRVLDGHMTAGALIASMALVWRILSPLQACFVSITRLEQVRNSIRQVNGLLRIPPERDPYAPVRSKKRFPGRVTFNRVSLRYTPDSEPALIGLSVDIKPGTILGVIGPNGAGKSTLLKLAAGLYQPQAGAVLMDGLDIRQLDPIELRKTIAYVPQTCDLFHGTVAQNLRLAEPTATDQDLREAADKAAVLEEILALPEGFETRIGDKARRLPSGMRQRLSLARAYLKKAPVVLFDEPGTALDADGDCALQAQLDAMRGNTTVIMVTHRPSHMKKADQLLVLDSGIVRGVGTPEEILSQLPEGFL